MKFNINHDYHIHSRLSLCSGDDGQTTQRIFSYATANNFNEICITDHFWDSNIDGASEFYLPQNFERVSSVLPLPQSENIKFYFGCETELDKNMHLGITDKMLDKFDIIIIPTTHLHMTGFTIDESFTSAEKRAEIYADRLDKLLDMDLPFDKIGIAHLTCPLIAYNYDTDWDEHMRIIDAVSTDTYKELFGKIARLGAGFELNFPIEKYSECDLNRILRPYRIAKEMGCKFYLGSDAHHPSELDCARERFEKIITVLGLTEADRFVFKKEKTMKSELIDRINYLAKKSREEGLTEAEKAEQAKLRQEYIAGFRQGFMNTMENVYIMDKDGNEKKVERKK